MARTVTTFAPLVPRAGTQPLRRARPAWQRPSSLQVQPDLHGAAPVCPHCMSCTAGQPSGSFTLPAPVFIHSLPAASEHRGQSWRDCRSHLLGAEPLPPPAPLEYVCLHSYTVTCSSTGTLTHIYPHTFNTCTQTHTGSHQLTHMCSLQLLADRSNLWLQVTVQQGIPLLRVAICRAMAKASTSTGAPRTPVVLSSVASRQLGVPTAAPALTPTKPPPPGPGGHH